MKYDSRAQLLGTHITDSLLSFTLHSLSTRLTPLKVRINGTHIMSDKSDTKEVFPSQTDVNGDKGVLQRTARDLLVGNNTGSTSNNQRNANQLLLDFVNLPRKQMSNDSLAKYLVNLFQKGIEYSLPSGPPLLLNSKGKFMKDSNGKSEVISEEDAIQFVLHLIDKAKKCDEEDSNGSKTEPSQESKAVKPSQEDIDESKASATLDEAKLEESKREEAVAKDGETKDTETTKDSKDEELKEKQDEKVKAIPEDSTKESNASSVNIEEEKGGGSRGDIIIKEEAEEGRKKDSKQENDDVKGGAATKDLDNEPGTYDIKLETSGSPSIDFAKHQGNQRFLQILQRNVAVLVGDPTIGNPMKTRIQTALAIVKETKNVFEEINGCFFVKVAEGGTCWKKLNETETAEFVLACVFEHYFQKDVPTRNKKVQSAPSSITREDLQSLIPTIGTAEISQFTDYSKPSTKPIEAPTESDVLFGRGGMTNNHPGNKRFRDVISLHRPDYVRAIKIEKPNVARRIVAAIRGGNPPGRFLKRNPTDLLWYDVGNRHATEKTSQALREKSQAEKNNGSISVQGDSRKRLLEQALYEARATRMRLSKGEGGSVGDGSTDTKSLELTISPQVWSYGLGGNTQPTTAQGQPPDKSEVGSSEAVMQNSHLRLDLKDLNMVDNTTLKGPSTSIGVLDPNGDILVTDNDILCGRGGMTNHHKGNKRFRDIVALHRPDYVRANKVNKPAVARMIIKAIRSGDPPGRFLKKDEKTGKWFDIGDRRAAEKASQALREKTPEERSKLRMEQQLSGNAKTATSAVSKEKLYQTKDNSVPVESTENSDPVVNMGLDQNKDSMSKDDADGDDVMNVEKVEI